MCHLLLRYSSAIKDILVCISIYLKVEWFDCVRFNSMHSHLLKQKTIFWFKHFCDTPKARISLSCKVLYVCAHVTHVCFYCQGSFSVANSCKDVHQTFPNRFNGCKQLFLSPSHFDYVRNFFATRKKRLRPLKLLANIFVTLNKSWRKDNICYVPTHINSWVSFEMIYRGRIFFCHKNLAFKQGCVDLIIAASLAAFTVFCVFHQLFHFWSSIQGLHFSWPCFIYDFSSV